MANADRIDELRVGKEKDTGYAPDQWAFDDEVTRVFEDMLRRSIPQYDVMRQLVARVASSYVQRGTSIVDLGASRGDAVAPLVDRFGAHVTFDLVEVSPPMLDVLRERYAGWIGNGVVRIHDLNLCDAFPPVVASVVMSVLTMCFIPIDRRQQLIQRAHDALVPGGAVVMVDKVLGSTATVDDMLVGLYHAMKVEHGYSQEEVERKRLSLQGVLVPVAARWNEEMLMGAGFAEVDCFWRCLNFAAWVAVKR